MLPLWKLVSGRFAGWRIGDALFDPSGRPIGFFVDDVAFSQSGDYVGELYDTERIGRKTTSFTVTAPRKVVPAANVPPAPPDRGPQSSRGWDDPLF
jgi:hypothetical protein